MKSASPHAHITRLFGDEQITRTVSVLNPSLLLLIDQVVFQIAESGILEEPDLTLVSANTTMTSVCNQESTESSNRTLGSASLLSFERHEQTLLDSSNSFSSGITLSINRSDLRNMSLISIPERHESGQLKTKDSVKNWRDDVDRDLQEQEDQESQSRDEHFQIRDDQNFQYGDDDRDCQVEMLDCRNFEGDARWDNEDLEQISISSTQSGKHESSLKNTVSAWKKNRAINPKGALSACIFLLNNY